MNELRYTLLSDGSSDKVLLPIITWLLQQHFNNCAIQAERAELGQLPRPPKTLAEKIQFSLELYPCNILFIHRDAEKQTPEMREREIDSAFQQAKEKIEQKSLISKMIGVIPVRMIEAWLLFDEVAIRKAAGNPNGKIQIVLPELKTLEQLPDPKEKLHMILREASELKGRKLKKLNTHQCIHRITELIEDFSFLRQLSAFQSLENKIQQYLLEMI